MLNVFLSFFSEVVECEEFLTLSPQQVSKLICSDRLTVPSEEKVIIRNVSKNNLFKTHKISHNFEMKNIKSIS